MLHEQLRDVVAPRGRAGMAASREERAAAPGPALVPISVLTDADDDGTRYHILSTGTRRRIASAPNAEPLRRVWCATASSGPGAPVLAGQVEGRGARSWRCFGWHCLSNAACLMRPIVALMRRFLSSCTSLHTKPNQQRDLRQRKRKECPVRGRFLDGRRSLPPSPTNGRTP